MFCFHKFLFLSVGLFDWGYTRTKFFCTVTHWRDTEMESLLPTLTTSTSNSADRTSNPVVMLKMLKEYTFKP